MAILVAYCNSQIGSILFLKEATLIINQFQFCTIQFIDPTYLFYVDIRFNNFCGSLFYYFNAINVLGIYFKTPEILDF